MKITAPEKDITFVKVKNYYIPLEHIPVQHGIPVLKSLLLLGLLVSSIITAIYIL